MPPEPSVLNLPRHPWWIVALIPVLRVFAWLLFLILGPVRVAGKKNIPRRGGVLLLSNHLADIDPIVLQMACPRLVFFMAKSELFEMPVIRRIIPLFCAFPVKRGEPDKAAIKKAVAYLKAGEPLCIFPEGELSQLGDLLPLKPGLALIIRMAEVPVVCCRLDNTNLVLPYGKLIPRITFRSIRVRWSEPLVFSKQDEPETILKAISERLAP